ncbi:hypothetical protein [Roseibium marinum]|uniref:hypothetical protein n=1 Tax=Roseibium marinum TaxID=281252 RepID=UPI0011AFB740|nr:hypothetical protein [Roseibium marinum]
MSAFDGSSRTLEIQLNDPHHAKSVLAIPAPECRKWQFALIYAHLAGQTLYVTVKPMRAIGALPEMEK